jgi:adenine-specific DNA methylase
MPVSPELSHVDATQSVVLEIERRALSIEDLYRFALLNITKALDLLRETLAEDSEPWSRQLAGDLDSLLGKVSASISTVTPPAKRSTPGVGISQTDVALAGYGTLRDGIANMYRSHHGAHHSGQCVVCQCLAKCAAIVDGVEQTLTRYMRISAAKLKSVHSGAPSHKAAPVPYYQGRVQRWRVTCPTCGVLQTFPIDKTQDAAKLAIRHRRSGVAHAKSLPQA